MGWIGLPFRAARRLVLEDEGLELSGYIAFTAFFALFPFLIFLAALASFLGNPETADDFIGAMFNLMPDDVAGTLAPAVREVLGAREGGFLTVGILITLWFASSGIEALRVGLNRAYGVQEARSIWWRRLQSIALVIVGGLVTFFVSLAIILGPLVWKVLGPGVAELLETQVAFVTMRYLLAILLLLGGLLLLHRWLPNTRQAFARVLPGVCVTTILWLTGASAFSWYVGHLAHYAEFYGSLGGVAITLMFFYVSAVLFIFGAEINAVWRESGERGRPHQAGSGAGGDVAAGDGGGSSSR